MTFSFTARVKVSEGVLIRELKGESVILNLNSEAYFGLDEVGTRMWAVLVVAESIQAAYETLQTEYEVEPEQLRQDIEQFVGRLAEQGLLEVAVG